MNTLETELDCQHRVRTVVGSKEVGGDAYCRFHGIRRITMIWPSEWRALCAECTWGRWCGQRESTAKRLARNHKHSNTIVVYDVVTKSGGTNRKTLIKKHLTPATQVDTFDPNEPIPF